MYEQDLMLDLYNVGKTKAVGYLPINTIVNICGVQIEQLLYYAKCNNIKSVVFKLPFSSLVNGGSVFFYNEQAVTSLLRQYRPILKQARIPHDSSLKFVKYIAKHSVPEYKYPEAFRVIGIAFGDTRFK